jgi:predicted secreted protein
MKQTAVEWLVEQICGDHTSEWHKEIEQAKAMEKEQIIEAFNQSWHDRMNPYKTADKYYKETYESNT